MAKIVKPIVTLPQALEEIRRLLNGHLMRDVLSDREECKYLRDSIAAALDMYYFTNAPKLKKKRVTSE